MFDDEYTPCHVCGNNPAFEADGTICEDCETDLWKQVVLGTDCDHGLTTGTCGICLGRWDHDVRSQVTGKLRSSREYIPWFVPAAVGHDRTPLHPIQVNSKGRSGNGCPSAINSPDNRPAPVVLPPVDPDMKVVGPPEWYRRENRNQQSVFDKIVAANGLDWYGMLEQHAADLITEALPSGTIYLETPLTYGPAAPRYGTRNLKAWRKATGRSMT